MKTAVDSSIVISIAKGEPAGKIWLECLKARRKVSRLMACEIVFAETRPTFQSRQQQPECIAKLGILYDPISSDPAALAGELFSRYRRAGGERERILPDFLIGAHAMEQADEILSGDTGFMRKYFDGLRLVGKD